MKKGDRIQLLEMPEEPDPIPNGTCGTVTHVEEPRTPLAPMQVEVCWDNHRTRTIVIPPDRARVLP